MTDIPTTMRAISLPEQNRDTAAAVRSLEVVERPVPEPGKAEVLVRMLTAPCNPSDLLHLQDMYGVQKSMPSVPGWEGCGEVIASGGGLMARLMVGRRVACAGQGDFDGTWSEYYVTRADRCVPLMGGVDDEQGSMLIVNPVTAVAMLDVARSTNKAPAVISLAAASQLGRMIIDLAGDYPVINVVRRQEQADLLKDLGAKHVVISTGPDDVDEIGALAHELRATVALDPIAGAMTGAVLHAMPKGSRIMVYGALSAEHSSGLDPLDFIFEDKHVTGFWLTPWVDRQSLLQIVLKTRRLQKLIIQGRIKSQVRARVGFDDFADALLEYIGDMTGGKVILDQRAD